jgi:hypothetical protein
VGDYFHNPDPGINGAADAAGLKLDGGAKDGGIMPSTERVDNSNDGGVDPLKAAGPSARRNVTPTRGRRATRFPSLELGRAVVAGVALLVLAAAGQASAATRDTLRVCPSGCDYTSIQGAINAASHRATILIAPGTYGGFSVPGTNSSLTNVTLRGAGAARTTISGGSPVVSIGDGVFATITGVAITNGSGTPDGSAGGISNDGTLTLQDATVSGNGGLFSGGITNNGAATLKHVAISGNSGGISNLGTMTLEDSIVSDNEVQFSAGGISNGGLLTLIDSTVSRNSASSDAGGISNSGTVMLAHSSVSGNSVDSGAGGIFNTETGTVILKDSTVSRNTGFSGGISNSGTVTLKHTTVSGNVTNSPFGNGGVGGGINNESGTLTLKDSRVSGNTATGFGGGIDNAGTGTVILKRSIVSGNTANTQGGGIDNAGTGTVILKHSTVSGNTPDNCYPPGSVAGCSG